MKALEISAYGDTVERAVANLKVAQKEIPKPGYGEVLIKMEAAPCNPSDLMFLVKKYGVTKPLPAVPGWEGAGTVVESGGGLLAWRLKGKRVACAGDGTWAEYSLASAGKCIPLRDDISFEQGASFIINPLTAIGLLERARGHKAIIQTAAASQVGKMVNALAEVPVIHIVRRAEQAKGLKGHVLNSSEEGFFRKLKTLAKELGATIAFEAIGGEMTGLILSAMPDEGKAVVYGALSEKPCSGISSVDLIFEKKSVEGFWLTDWIRSKGMFGMIAASKRASDLLASGTIATEIAQKVSLEEAPEAILAYSKNMSKGKVMICPR